LDHFTDDIGVGLNLCGDGDRKEIGQRLIKCDVSRLRLTV